MNFIMSVWTIFVDIKVPYELDERFYNLAKGGEIKLRIMQHTMCDIDI